MDANPYFIDALNTIMVLPKRTIVSSRPALFSTYKFGDHRYPVMRAILKESYGQMDQARKKWFCYGNKIRDNI